MSQSAKIQCPRCKKRYRVAESHENRQVVCQRCDHRFAVPAREDHSRDALDSDRATVFDSLDIDGLLNSPSSGWGSTKKRTAQTTDRKSANKGRQNQNQNRSQRSPTQSANRRPANRDANHGSNATGKPAKASNRNKRSGLDPTLIEQELDAALAAKDATKKKNAASVSDSPAAKPSNSGPPPGSTSPPHRSRSVDGLADEEEQAIYRAVSRQNRRRNFVGALIALSIVLLVGGYFTQAELQRLQVPMTQEQRDWLTERGFVLKASPVPNRPGGGREKNSPLVIVAAGKDFSDIDKFAVDTDDKDPIAGNGLGGNGLAGDGLGDDRFGNRQPDRGQPAGLRLPRGRNGNRDFRRQPKLGNRVAENRIIDFDTNANPNELAKNPIGYAKALESHGEVATAAAGGGFYFAEDGLVKGITGDGTVFEQRTINPSIARVSAMTTTNDGRRLIVGGDSGQVLSYRLDAKGRLRDEFLLDNVHRQQIIALGVTPDSQRLVVYSSDGRMTLWRLSDQQLQWNVSDLVPQQRLHGLRLTEDSALISSDTGTQVVPLNGDATESQTFAQRFQLLAPDRSGTQLVFADDSRLGVIDADSKEIIWTRSLKLAGHPKVEYSPDLETAFYYDDGRSAVHFDLASGRVINRFGDTNAGGRKLNGVRHLHASVDGQHLLAIGNNNRHYLYPVEVSKPVDSLVISPPLPLPPRNYPPVIDPSSEAIVEVATVGLAAQNPTAVCLDNRGHLIVALQNGRVIVVDWVQNLIADERFEDGRNRITCLQTIDDQLLIGRSSGAIELATIEPGGKLSALRWVSGPENAVGKTNGNATGNAIEFLGPIAETTLFFSVSNAGNVGVWDLETGNSVYAGRPLQQRPLSVAVDRRSDVLIADGRKLVTVDYKTGSVKEKSGDRRVNNVQLSFDGKKLAFLDRNQLNVATTSRGDVTTELPLPRGVNGITFSPDSKLLFLISSDNVTVVRVRGGKELYRFPIASNNRSQMKIVFSADGQFMTLWSRSSNGEFKIYATPSS